MLFLVVRGQISERDINRCGEMGFMEKTVVIRSIRIHLEESVQSIFSVGRFVLDACQLQYSA